MNNKELRDKFIQIHGKDQEQLDFILSEKKRILVTAPAGCGKTKAMISKIAHEIITNRNLGQKKILALTFSVNAASKIRDDINETLPLLLCNDNFDIDKKLDVTNYHGFANRLLRKHGYALNNNLKNINDFLRVPDESRELRKLLVEQEIQTLKDYDSSLKTLNFKEAERLQSIYIDIVLNKLVPKNIITYNGLILLATELLDKKAVSEFYKIYYQMVIVDEFQDTNYLALQFLRKFIHANKIILMGDDIQKIYGFLGAVPNLFKKMESDYDMFPMEFVSNYRFKDNKDMKQLDNYIRGVFKNYNDMDNYSETAKIKFKFYKSDFGEANFIFKDLSKRIEKGNNVAILFRSKYASDNIIEVLENHNQSYFNGLFDDSDNEYINFHKRSLEIFIKESGARRSVSKSVMTNIIDNMKVIEKSITSNKTMFKSLMRLLEALLGSVSSKRIPTDDKYERILFTLNSNSLKRLMNEINEKVTLTTIHASKGLEWDYVYLPKMTAYSFPTSNGLCKSCKHNHGANEFDKHCEFKFVPSLEDNYSEELSVLYVGLTRAKKDVFLTANSGKNDYGYHKKICCFLTLPNLKKITDF